MDKKEKKRLYDIEYRKNNKEKIKKTKQEWIKKNPDKIKKYRENNKEKKKLIDKLYRENNKEKENLRKKEWAKKNPDKIRKAKSKYFINKIKSDYVFRLRHNISNVIRQSLKRRRLPKNKTTNIIIGCSYEELKLHLESKFESWMNWDNYGLYNGEENYGWDIDHIIPISKAKTEEEVIKLNHYSNLQPLCSYYNRYVKKNI